MKKKIIYFVCIAILTMTAFSGCNGFNSLKDGYYAAEMAEFSHGWKEYLRIQVKNGAIVSAEYNAKNASGFIKAWDNSYMENMFDLQGTYPNKYTREYVQQLLDEQSGVQVDIITGATSSGNNFEKLVEAVLRQAESGNSETVLVE